MKHGVKFCILQCKHKCHGDDDCGDDDDYLWSHGLPFCYLYAVQGPQATMIPLFLAHFTNYKEVTDDDDDDYDNDYDDKDKLQFQCISI